LKRGSDTVEITPLVFAENPGFERPLRESVVLFPLTNVLLSFTIYLIFQPENHEVIFYG